MSYESLKDSARRAMFAKINKDKVNDIEATEITLGALSDGDFYRKVVNPNAKNIEKHMIKGKFQKSHLLTKKSYLDHLGKEAITRYEEEFGTPSDPMHINADTRRQIGQNVAEKIFDLARDEARIHGSAKRTFLVAKKFNDREEYQERNKNIEDIMRSL